MAIKPSQDEGPPLFDPDDPGPEIDAADPLDALITRFNRQYMVVNEEGKAVIYEPMMDPALNRRRYRRITFDDFRKMYMNTLIQVGTSKSKQPVFRTHAEAWLQSPLRRQYLGGVIFDPSGVPCPHDVFNLWTGFAIKPAKGSWQRLKDHTLEIICGGNTDYFDWLMGWMARLVQRPGEQGEIAVVMRSIQGTGKGTLAKAICRLFGQHAMLITNVKHLTGHFNAHQRDCIFLFADEAFFAGDPQHVGTLKSMITDDMLTIEGKFQNAVQAKNYMHIMMASNNDWVIPAEVGDRRFFMQDVIEGKIRDFAYFGAIQKELNSGGYEAMLYDLLRYDISDFNHRLAPQTKALDDQKKRSLPFELQWWMECLHRGYIHRSTCGLSDYFEQWRDTISKALCFGAYVTAAAKSNQRRALTEEFFGRFMVQMGATLGRNRSLVTGEEIADIEGVYGGSQRKARLITKAGLSQSYVLGSMQEARENFETRTSIRVIWSEPSSDDGE